MDTVKIMALAIVGVLMALVLKDQKQYLGTTVAIMCAACLAFMMLPYLESVVSYVKILNSSLDGGILRIILKITGIGTLATLTSDICRDAGLSSIASLVVISGKAICMCVVLPVIGNFLGEIVSILP